MHAVVRLPSLVRELTGSGYDYRIAWWIVLYVDRYDTLSGCPWVRPEDLPRLRAIIGERIPKDFTPDAITFRIWCVEVGITSTEPN